MRISDWRLKRQKLLQVVAALACLGQSHEAECTASDDHSLQASEYPQPNRSMHCTIRAVDSVAPTVRE